LPGHTAAIFGFSNCEDPREEYGVPHADYNLKGKVIDKSDSKPLKESEWF
jgi:hypothetical protein